MTISLKHATQAVGTYPDDGELGVTEWNEEHALTMSANFLLGRATAGDGAVEEIACTAAGRSMIAAADAAAQKTLLGFVWGDIGGTLTSQTDLQSALDGKSATGHTHDDRYYTDTEVDTLLTSYLTSAVSATASAKTAAETARDAAVVAKVAAEAANDQAQAASNIHEAVAGNVGTLMAAFGQAWEELQKVMDGQDDNALTSVHVLNLAQILGQISDQVNGGRVTLAGGTLADPALRIGTVGIYSAAANTLSVAISGVERLRVTASGITVYGTVTNA